ncbi:MAG: hypothetical protein WCC74_02670 [Minisyncoccia bacterium]
MIKTFTQNLPLQLSLQIQEQYENYLPIFKSYADSNNIHYLEIKNNFEISCFILVLAIFYKTVVIPLKEGSLCFNNFQDQNIISEIQIGKYLFSNNDRRKIQGMYSELQVILEKYNIPEYLLLFSDVKDFARNLNSYLNNKNA